MLEFRIVEADIATVAVDMLALKYAQAHYGVDAWMAQRLASVGVDPSPLQPPVGEHTLLGAHGVIATPELLVIGVPRLRSFGYEQIQLFAYDALAILARERPSARSVALTLHGAGFGLDEVASFQSELTGLQQAWASGQAPAGLGTVLLIERNASRCARLRQALARFIQESRPSEVIAGPNDSAIFLSPQADTIRPTDTNIPRAPEQSVSHSSASAQSHAFVAMPYSMDFEDLFHYGIQTPVNQNNLLCERVDLSVFTGDIVEYMRGKIETASVVIGVLTGSNPNVYLEVGYAWGREIPTILTANNVDDLKFDVKGQKCLEYKSITNLEQLLNAELEALKIAGRLAPHM
jgi:hypothetical protein